MQKRIIFFSVIAIGVLVGLMVLPSYLKADGRTYDLVGGPDDHIEVLLESSRAPHVGETVVFTLTATPFLDAPSLNIHWDLPDGLELIAGTLAEETDPLAANETIQRSVEVRVKKPGTFQVAAVATYAPHATAVYGATGVLFVTSSNHHATISDRDPALINLNDQIIPGSEPTFTPSHTAKGNSAAEFCVRIRGRLTRKDKVPYLATTNQLVYADSTIPVTHAVVEVWEADPVFDDFLGQASLDDNGEIMYTICGEDDGLFDDELEIYVEVVAAAERWDPDDGLERVVTVYDKDEWAGLFTEYKFASHTAKISSDGELRYNLRLENNEGMSGALNIVEAIYDAWEFFNASGGLDGGWLADEEIDVNWAPGWTSVWRDGSFYSWFWNEIYLNGDASDKDEWDDSVIIHEWTHHADDVYSCDSDGGKDHYVTGIYSTEMAFSEGYPDYYQSAVRAAYNIPFADWYIDMNGSGTSCAVCEDIDSWNTDNPTRVTDGNEMAVAATLWDIYDLNNENDDRLTLGHNPIQEVFTSNRFADADKCTLKGFFAAWADIGKPTDAAVAAIITQNVMLNDIFDDTTTIAKNAVSANSATASPNSATFGTQSPLASEQSGSLTEPFPWWERLALVVDNSASMSGARLDAVKTAVQTQVTRLSGLATGVEFSLDLFNNGSNNVQPIFTGQFFADRVNPIIAGLSTTAVTDNDCSVNALNALEQTINGRYDSDVWLFTDGPASGSDAGVADISRRLVNQQLRASFIALGLCNTSQINAANEQLPTQNQRAWQEIAGLGPEDPPDNIVPYLQIALNSGGQFMFIDDSQMDMAAEILEAQITHSAGAGRWSDYVSDHRTYRWDKLTSWEYSWIDARSQGTNHGKPGGLTSEGWVDVTMYSGGSYCRWRFYESCVETAHVYENGYITFDSFLGEQAVNSQLPNPSAPNWVLYPFWDDLEWESIGFNGKTGEVNAPDNGTIYSRQVRDTFAIEYYGFHPATGTVRNTENFQVQFEFDLAGSIRFLYKNLETGVGSATIGLEDGRTATKNDAVQISFNNPNAVASEDGFGLYRVPPQPSKVYTTLVDSTMESIAFLLTGFSGSFDPLKITLPDGTMINCHDADVLCIEAGLVQYVQIDVNGRTGEWIVEVSAGSSGSGTFNFSSMAVSPLGISNKGDYDLSPVDSNHFVIDLGYIADNNQVTGQLRRAGDIDLGDPFMLHDDGQHEDGLAGDGVFGSDLVTPVGKSLAFLAVNGTIDGQPFRRVDATPYRLPYVTIEGPETAVDTGSGLVTTLTVTNHRSTDHCYLSELHAPAGWKIGLDTGSTEKVCVPAGQSKQVPFTAKMDLSGDMPSGTSGVISVTLIEEERGIYVDTLTVKMTRQRPPASLAISSDGGEVRPGGDKVQLYLSLLDEQNVMVPDGTVINLQTTLGSVPAEVSTIGGQAMVEFTSGSQTGTATITAVTGDLEASTNIVISAPEAARITIEVNNNTLPADGQSTSNVTAIVTDRWGDPMANQWVILSVSGDGQHGLIDGKEGLIAQSNSDGTVAATYTSGLVGGEVALQADLLSDDQVNTLASARTTVTLQSITSTVLLPIVISAPTSSN